MMQQPPPEIGAILDALTEQQKQVILLLGEREMTAEEIAMELDSTASEAQEILDSLSRINP